MYAGGSCFSVCVGAGVGITVRLYLIVNIH
jgi:hypothetical protein